MMENPKKEAKNDEGQEDKSQLALKWIVNSEERERGRKENNTCTPSHQMIIDTT